MNYKKIYDLIIERSKHRILTGYKESHHIIPRCLGGTDDEHNLTDLTPEEHYLCHLLLVKIYPNNIKLVKAAMFMTSSNINVKRNNKAYGWLRRQYAESMSGDNNPNRRDPEIQKKAALKRVGQKRTEETKARMSAAQKGRIFTEETKRNMAIAAKNRPPISEETRAKLKSRKPNKGMLGRTMSAETKAKMSASQQGRTDSAETKLKKSLAAKAREAKKKEAV